MFEANTAIYLAVFRSYVSKPDLFGWAKLWLRFPLDTIRIYFFSNFFFIPALFVAVERLSRGGAKREAGSVGVEGTGEGESPVHAE